MILNFDAVQMIDDLPRKTIRVDAWDGDVLIRSLRASERSQLEERFTGKTSPNPAEFRAAMLQAALINEDGTPWLKNGDAEQLMKKSAAAVEQIFDAVLEFNAMVPGQEDVIAKNSQRS